VLCDLAARLYQVGWGLDLVAGNAELTNASTTPLSGERWIPTNAAGSRLRIPRPTTRRFLQDRHERFLDRLSKNTLIPVPPLPHAAYETISYCRAWQPASASVAAFGFLQLNGSGYRAFDYRRGCQIAGMLRHAVAEMARTVGWSESTVSRFVLGHAEPKGVEPHQPVGRDRFAYVPLPSIERRSRDLPAQHVGMIRRAMIYAPAGGRQGEIDTLRRMLAGCELSDAHQQPQALITMLPHSDAILRRYLPQKSAYTWSTVTPVILPGHDDRKDQKTDALLRKALRQAGYADELVQHAELVWRDVGFWPGADRVDRYFVPQHLREYPRYHVQVTWQDAGKRPVAIPGPVVFGGGRYSGLGLCASEAPESTQ
jgi:CRISPR-associated protein Csb2